MSGLDGLSLRRLSAAELLEIRREVNAMELTDELERGIVGNAMVLAHCCEESGRRAFESGQAALECLTAAEMERLLCRLRDGESGNALPVELPQESAGNDGFDEAHFLRLKEGDGWTM